MAVERSTSVISMSADGDVVAGNFYVQAIHVSGAVANITDGAGNLIAAFGDEGSVIFPNELRIAGLSRGAGAGTLFVYIS